MAQWVSCPPVDIRAQVCFPREDVTDLCHVCCSPTLQEHQIGLQNICFNILVQVKSCTYDMRDCSDIVVQYGVCKDDLILLTYEGSEVHLVTLPSPPSL